MEDSEPQSVYISGDYEWTAGWPDGYIIKVALEPADKLPPYEFLAVGLLG